MGSCVCVCVCVCLYVCVEWNHGRCGPIFTKFGMKVGMGPGTDIGPIFLGHAHPGGVRGHFRRKSGLLG